jgi:two-component system response regulator YesN
VKSRFRFNFFVKILIFSFLIGSFPSSLVGMFSFAKVSNTIESMTVQSKVSLLRQTQKNVEQELGTLDNAVTQFINSSLLTRVFNQRLNSDKYALYDEIVQDLNRLQVNSLTLREIYLLNTTYQWGISTKGLYPLADLPQAEELLKYGDLSPHSSFWLRELKQEKSEGQLDQVVLVKQIPINAVKPAGLMILKFSTGDISRLLNQNGAQGVDWIMDEHHVPIPPGLPSLFDIGEMTASIYPEINGMEALSGFFKTGINGGDQLVVFQKSTFLDWVYISVVPMEHVLETSHSIGWITLWICLGVTAVTLIAALLGSKKIYTPVRRLYDIVWRSVRQEQLPRAADELQYIGAGFRIIEDERERLTGLVNIQTLQIEELFAIKLLQGKLRKSEVGEQWHRFGYPSDWRWMCVLALQIDTLEGTSYDSNDSDLLLFAIGNMVTDVIPASERIQPVILEESQVILIGTRSSSPQQFVEDIYRTAERLAEVVKSYLHLQISIGFSRPFTDAVHSNIAFQEGMEALKYRMKLGNGLILFIEDAGRNEPKAVFPAQIANELIDAINNMDQERSKQLLREFLDEASRMNATPRDFQLFFVRLVVDVLRQAESLGTNPLASQLEASAVLEQIFHQKSIKDLEHWMTETIIDPLIVYLQSSSEFHYKTISEKIIKIIHEEFDTDLTLELLSNRLHYHPSYIKQVLRKELNTNFTEYLANYRFLMAKKWLRESDMKIAAIAEKLQYQNSQNFIRSFRKVEGTTPGDYRKKFREIQTTERKL